MIEERGEVHRRLCSAGDALPRGLSSAALVTVCRVRLGRWQADCSSDSRNHRDGKAIVETCTQRNREGGKLVMRTSVP